MNVAIIGSGFGLYGYLPALLRLGEHRALLPERYRARLQGRPDVRDLGRQVFWHPDETALLDAADALIVTQRPQDQAEHISDWLRRPNIKRFLLEKPLAPTPRAAFQILDAVERSGRFLRTGCTFRYTPWGRAFLEEPLKHPVEFAWSFSAHHYSQGLFNWKRSVPDGGGALRFFGIQLLALLAERGYRQVAHSEFEAANTEEAETWNAEFRASDLPPCTVTIASNAAKRSFSLTSGGLEVSLEDPFGTSMADDPLDRRIGVLTDLCREFLQEIPLSLTWHRPWIELWAAAEEGFGS